MNAIELTLGWRNLLRHPLRTGLTVVALAVGIAALTFLSAMNDGWMQQIKANFALTTVGHIQIHARGFALERKPGQRIRHPRPLRAAVEALPGVRATTLRIRRSGLASSARGNAGAQITAVLPEAERRVSRLAGFVTRGRWLVPHETHAAVIGAGLAERLGVGLGDKLVLMAAVSGGEIASELFRVRGILHSGVLELDDMTVLVPLAEAQRWLGLGDAVTDLVIRADDFAAVTPLAEELRRRYAPDGLEVMRWFDIDPMARQWSDFADAYTWIVLLVVIAVVLAEVLNTMLMSVHDRVREFGLMGALGATPVRIFAMVVWETLILVLLGGLAGFTIGAMLVFWFGAHGIDLTRFAAALSFMYMDPVIHPRLEWAGLLRILAAAVAGALLAGLIPAARAARLEPATALRAA
ncbi:MAG: ABC transporter permease [Zetaproteobacteria bacterium]|nr:MAG: ABC transporter permease [Zetaproteobacteria bacterium]